MSYAVEMPPSLSICFIGRFEHYINGLPKTINIMHEFGNCYRRNNNQLIHAYLEYISCTLTFTQQTCLPNYACWKWIQLKKLLMSNRSRKLRSCSAFYNFILFVHRNFAPLPAQNVHHVWNNVEGTMAIFVLLNANDFSFHRLFFFAWIRKLFAGSMGFILVKNNETKNRRLTDE